MKLISKFILLILISSCGRTTYEFSTAPVETSGNQTQNIQPVSIDLQDLSAGPVCTNGGITLTTFYDVNKDSVLDENESIIKSKSICNGSNGSNGSNGQSVTISFESFSSSSQCSNGGIKINSSQSSSVEICNGVNGINGEQGLPGIQGIPGIAGAKGDKGDQGDQGVNGANGTPGSIVLPIKFCPSDNSSFPEYGLKIDNEIFAVFYSTTPSSPNSPQAFLSKLTMGQYQSTGGNNCLFYIP